MSVQLGMLGGGGVFSTIPTTLNAMPIICDATWIVWSGVECHAGIAV